jgi:signal transduction histidine kinase
MGGNAGSSSGGGQTARHPWLAPALADQDQAAGMARRSSRDWTVDAGCFLLAAAAAATSLIGDVVADPQVRGWLLAADATGGVLASAAMWVRRRWPVTVALVLVGVSAFCPPVAVATGIAVFTVALYRRFPVAVTISVLTVAASMLRNWLRPPGLMPYLAWVIVSILAAVAVLAWGMFARARRRLMLSLRERARRAETEQALRSQQVRRLERDRIAREMHDVLAHRLSLLSLQAGALEFRPDAVPADIAAAAEVIRASAHQALNDLREVIAVLREDAAGTGEDLAHTRLADVPSLVGESRQAGVCIELDNQTGDCDLVPERTGRTVYQIVREALTNSRKHAAGCPVTIRINGAAGSGLTVEIRNPLPGPAKDVPGIPGTGTGLIGLGERVALAGGRLTHGPVDAADFRVHAWLPWPS